MPDRAWVTWAGVPGPATGAWWVPGAGATLCGCWSLVARRVGVAWLTAGCALRALENLCGRRAQRAAQSSAVAAAVGGVPFATPSTWAPRQEGRCCTSWCAAARAVGPRSQLRPGPRSPATLALWCALRPRAERLPGEMRGPRVQRGCVSPGKCAALVSRGPRVCRCSPCGLCRNVRSAWVQARCVAPCPKPVRACS